MSFLSRCVVIALSLLCGACSSFQSEWRSAGSGDRFSGRWEGEWKSAKHRGAGGRLRCVLGKEENVAPAKDGSAPYRAHFHARWLAFSSSYTAALRGEQTGNVLRLSGQHRLTGFGGGVYEYAGRVTPERFTATYRSSYDEGVFEMQRIAR